MWTYSQNNGHLFADDGEVVAIGYSGNGAAKNNPSMQHVRGHGPTPQGMWKIAGKYDSAKVGKYALTLEPMLGTDTFGRSAFRIHGDSSTSPGEASDGCIIVPLAVRKRVWESGDHLLRVIP